MNNQETSDAETTHNTRHGGRLEFVYSGALGAVSLVNAGYILEQATRPGVEAFVEAARDYPLNSVAIATSVVSSLFMARLSGRRS
jgi:hypothetical protein